ncbi:unnamed protein product [Schistocephalus solidus]|uniref:Uncharacterized protein n=1 Tax=Schistocephalus solidus TaxID=70667 RepID=A0A183S9J1_SCHSO|nr:unnamed protein product [Schistocephalus solidus]
MKRVSNSGGHPHNPDKLKVNDDNDLWEDRMKVYLEAIDEDAHPAAIRGRLDNEVFAVARAAKLTASLTPAKIFEHLRCEFGRSSMPWVARAALENLREHAEESVVDFQRHVVYQVLIPPRSPSSIKVSLDVARREEAIHLACPLVQVCSPSASACCQAPAAIKDTSFDVFAMGQRQSRHIGTKIA